MMVKAPKTLNSHLQKPIVLFLSYSLQNEYHLECYFHPIFIIFKFRIVQIPRIDTFGNIFGYFPLPSHM